MSGWVGVDLDGTLAKYDGWADGSIGDPIPLMVEQVKAWLRAGIEVRIFTARVANNGAAVLVQKTDGSPMEKSQHDLIQEWCEKHIGKILAVTCSKDFAMSEMWDDRAIGVEFNTGKTKLEALTDAARDRQMKNDLAKTFLEVALKGSNCDPRWKHRVQEALKLIS